MISLQQALELMSSVTALGTETVTLDEAAGRILAEDIAAPWDLPTRTHAAMDGVAVRAQEVTNATATAPVRLPVATSVHAGDRLAPTLLPGTAVTITTGSGLPVGADAVIREEDLEHIDNAVLVRTPVVRGHNVRTRGEDVAAGAAVLKSGTPIDARAIGVLAMFGRVHVPVFRRPRVAVLASGDELVSALDARPDAVVDSNTPMLVAMARECLATAEGLEVVPDDFYQLTHQLQQQIGRVDVMITSAGVSVGPRDHVPAALQALGAQVVFAKVAIKPGKPVTYARAGSTHLLCLPGNPGAAAVTFELFGRPLLARLAGAPVPPRTTALLTAPVPHKVGLAYGLWAQTRVSTAGLVIEDVAPPHATNLVPTLERPALALVSHERGDLAAGEAVDVVLHTPPLPRRVPPVLGVVGLSNTGKTTLIAALVSRLSPNLRVAVVKHGHRFDLDRPGKDTYRFAEAGACAVAFASPSQRGLIAHTSRPPALAEVLASLPDDVDFVLVEGYKLAALPKLEVIGPDGRSLTRDGEINAVVGVVSRAGPIDVSMPCFAAEDIDGVEAWIRTEVLSGRIKYESPLVDLHTNC